MRYSSISVVTLFLISVLFVSCDNESPVDPLAPRACFEIAEQNLYAKVGVSFNSECTKNAVHYFWDFGDGSVSTDAMPTHIYAEKGDFTVTLIIEDAEGNSSEFSKKISLQASPFTEHAGYIDQAEVWAEGKHLVTSNVYVRQGSLTIMPGAEIYINKNRSIFIGDNATTTPNGALLTAKGTAAKPIVFKPASGIMQPGEWGHLFFTGKASLASEMDYCQVMYGGKTDSWFDYESGTYYNSYGLIDIINVGVEITNTEIKGAANFGVGLRGYGYFTQFDNNTLKENASYPISINIDRAHTIGTGNTFESTKGIYLHSQYYKQLNATWRNHSVPYILEGQKMVGSGTVEFETLTLEPGTTIAFKKGASLIVDGRLVAEGTASNPITFTSAETTKQPGDWVAIEGSANNVYKFCRFEYGGKENFQSHSRSLYVGSGSIVENCTVTDSKGRGIEIGGTLGTFTNNTITKCGTHGIVIGMRDFHKLNSTNIITETKGVLINAVGVFPSGDFVWEKRPYTLTMIGALNVYSTEGSMTLTFAPGLVLNLEQGATIQVGISGISPLPGVSSLIADGTTERIVLKTTDENVAANIGWGYITFDTRTTTASRLINCDLLNGGHTYDSWMGVIDCKGTVGAPIIKDCKIANTYNHAISLYNNATPVLENNTFENIAGEMIHNY